MADILDAACGGRMWWYDKEHDNAIYVDRRTSPKGHLSISANHAITPDYLMDFTDLKFEDESFHLVLFDPPHIIRGPKSDNSNFVKCYGRLDENWKDVISRGFNECWRVVKPKGTVIFKWNESSISLKSVLDLLTVQPIVGSRPGGRRLDKTHYLVFFKEEE